MRNFWEALRGRPVPAAEAYQVLLAHRPREGITYAVAYSRVAAV